MPNCIYNNTGLETAGIIFENNGYGKAPDLTGIKYMPITHVNNSPINIQGNLNKEVIRNANGSNVTGENSQLAGVVDVAVEFPEKQIPANGFIIPLSMMLEKYSFNLGVHTLAIETSADKCLSKSWKLIIPRSSPKEEIQYATGVIANSMSINVVQQSYSVGAVGRVNGKDTYISFNDENFLFPDGTDEVLGHDLPVGRGRVYLGHGVGKEELDVTEMSITFEKIIDTDNARRGGYMERVQVGGINTTGNITMARLKDDTDGNIANAIIEQTFTSSAVADATQPITIQLSNGITLEFFCKLSNETKNQGESLETISADFTVVKSTMDEVVKATIEDGYELDLSSYYALI